MRQLVLDFLQGLAAAGLFKPRLLRHLLQRIKMFRNQVSRLAGNRVSLIDFGVGGSTIPIVSPGVLKVGFTRSNMQRKQSSKAVAVLVWFQKPMQFWPHSSAPTLS